MKPYPMELRERVMAAYDECGSPEKVAARFAVHVRWIYQLIDRRKETGSIAALPPSGRHDHAKLHEDTCALMAAWVDEKNDMTLAQMQARLAERGIDVSQKAIWTKLDAMGLTYKKKPARRGARSSGHPRKTGSVASPAGGNPRGKARVS